MAVYDMLMLVVLASATIFGVIKGFAWQVASLASIVVSYFVAYRYRNDIAARIEAEYPWNIFLGMLLIYAAVSFAIWIAFRFVSGVIDKVRLKEFDRHLGALLGFGKGVLLCVIITMFAMTLLDSEKQQAICQSRSGFFISKLLSKADGILPKEVDEMIGPMLAKLEQQLQASRSGASESSSSLFAGGATGNSGQAYDWQSNGTAEAQQMIQSAKSGLSNWLTSSQNRVLSGSVPGPESAAAGSDPASATGSAAWSGGASFAPQAPAAPAPTAPASPFQYQPSAFQPPR
jgi:uncharacterized membrane protein required for colicin V production